MNNKIRIRQQLREWLYDHCTFSKAEIDAFMEDLDYGRLEHDLQQHDNRVMCLSLYTTKPCPVQENVRELSRGCCYCPNYDEDYNKCVRFVLDFGEMYEILQYYLY